MGEIKPRITEALDAFEERVDEALADIERQVREARVGEPVDTADAIRALELAAEELRAASPRGGSNPRREK